MRPSIRRWLRWGPIQCAENQVFSPDATITPDPKSIEKGYYLIPVVISPISDAGYAVKEGSVHYIFVTKVAMDVETARRRRRLEDRSDLGMDDHLLSGYCDERRHRCLELRSAAQKAAMFDGKLDGNCW